MEREIAGRLEDPTMRKNRDWVTWAIVHQVTLQEVRRVILTPASNLDDQVAVENSAASQSLRWSYRVNRLIPYAEFRTQACTWWTGQPTWRKNKWETVLNYLVSTCDLVITGWYRTENKQECYTYLIQNGIILLHSVQILKNKWGFTAHKSHQFIENSLVKERGTVVIQQNSVFKRSQTTTKNTMHISARRDQKWNEAGLYGMRQECSMTQWCGMSWDRGWHGIFKTTILNLFSRGLLWNISPIDSILILNVGSYRKSFLSLWCAQAFYIKVEGNIGCLT